MRDLNPTFTVSKLQVVLDIAALAAFPSNGLATVVTNLSAHSQDVLAALVTLFDSY
jgi:CcdB protein